MSSSPWPCEHQDDILSDAAARGYHSCPVGVPFMEASLFVCIVAKPHRREKHANKTNCSLPGAMAMYALSLGVQRINDTLPGPVYGLLTGLNASTVGIIALAAVQLAEKAITDKLSRVLVIAGACAGLCYNTLWYFPLLIALGGIITVIWDGWLDQQIGKIRANWKRRRQATEAPTSLPPATDAILLEERTESADHVQRRPATIKPSSGPSSHTNVLPQHSSEDLPPGPDMLPLSTSHPISPKIGLIIIALFLSKPHLPTYSLY